MKPEIVNSGINAAIVVSDDDITGANMRRAPPSAASSDPSPVWKWVSASSPTTIASSTMIPSAMISANSEIMLMLAPAR